MLRQTSCRLEVHRSLLNRLHFSNQHKTCRRLKGASTSQYTFLMKTYQTILTRWPWYIHIFFPLSSLLHCLSHWKIEKNGHRISLMGLGYDQTTRWCQIDGSSKKVRRQKTEQNRWLEWFNRSHHGRAEKRSILN